MPISAEVGSLGIRIAQIPSAVQSNPKSGIYIVSHLSPSTSVSQRIEVTNSSASPMNVSIYPGAATNSGENFVALPDGVTNELTSWTRISPASGVIPAHGHIEAIVTIDTPALVTPGEQFGVIWASVSSAPGLNGIMNVNRVGIRMYDSVGTIMQTKSASSLVKPPWISTHELELQWILIAALTAVLLRIILRKARKWRKKRRKAAKARARRQN